MNTIKKLLCIFLVISCIFIVSCNEPNIDPPENKDYWDADGNGIPDWQEKDITLTFATWQYTNEEMVTIDSLMADAFMAKYPNIKIEFVVVGEEYDYETNMLALMETNETPDVFLIRRLENFLSANLLQDITEFYDNDEDSQYIFKSLQNSGVYENKRYAVPTYIYPQFWVVNKTLLSEKNIPLPTYDWTWDQMVNIAKQATDTSKHVLGLYAYYAYYGQGANKIFLNELPKILKMKQNKEVGLTWNAYAFDGERFNFDDQVVQDAMNQFMDGINEGWTSLGLTAEQLNEYYNDEAYVLTQAGKSAIWVEPSWSFKDSKSNINFDWDVYPGPSGVTSGNTDIIGISSLSKNKQAAYQFLKWMSYGEDGILERFNIYKTSGSELYQQGNNYPYPIVDYGIDASGVNKIWSSIPYSDTAKGLVSPQFIEALRNGAYTLNKEVCGWDAVDYAVGGYLKEVYEGTNTYASAKESIQRAADEELSRIRESLKELMN